MNFSKDYRAGKAPEDAISFSWGQHLRDDSLSRQRIYIHRDIGSHLKHIHDRLGDVGWIYYQDASNTALQYPFIDQVTAIPSDFDWSTYHTYISVCPENNPHRTIQWTPPSIDYAGEGLILSVSIPVWQDELFVGLWSIDLPIRYLYIDFATSASHPQNLQFIANKEGMLILHEKLQAKVDQSKGSIILHSIAEMGGQWETFSIKEFIDQREGTFSVTDNSHLEWLFYYKYVEGVEWILFCGLPRPAMEEAAAQRLSQAFQQIADGNYSHRIESTSFNALPTLVDEFNKMSLRLSQAVEHREEIEGQLRQAQKMDAIGRLAGGVAHDYNNMLTVIIGYAEMALEQISENNPLHNFLQQIFDAAKRSMDLTRQLLAFARRQAISPKVLDINAVVSSMLKMLQRLIGEDIHIIWIPCDDVWSVKIDPSQVDQIMANLCVNSRDAISGVGKLRIQTENIELDESYCSEHCGFKPGQFVQLTVSDNGIGIDSEIIDKIFEPFFSTKAIGRGTGLGLATVYGIVKQNGGYVNVYSEPGVGTTFKIFLPRVDRKIDEIADQSTSAAHKGNGESIMLVEDDTAILELTNKMLTKLNYQVLAVNSPLEALSVAEQYQNTIDLLLTDVVMPELTGNDLAQKIISIYPDIKVLFMSGYTVDTIVDQGVLEDNMCFIEKPFSISKLSEKVREVLKN
jgi:signal transduction histidine kinase/CheY-like chemotaxis protein